MKLWCDHITCTVLASISHEDQEEVQRTATQMIKGKQQVS